MALAISGSTPFVTRSIAPSGWATIQSDLLLLVFSRLKPHERSVASLACRRWQEIHFKQLKDDLLASLEDTVNLVVQFVPSTLLWAFDDGAAQSWAEKILQKQPTPFKVDELLTLSGGDIARLQDIINERFAILNVLWGDIDEAMRLNSCDYCHTKRKERKISGLWPILEKQVLACVEHQTSDPPVVSPERLEAIKRRFLLLACSLPNFQEIRSATTCAAARVSFLQAFRKFNDTFRHNFKFPRHMEDFVVTNVFKNLMARGQDFVIWDLLPHTTLTSPSISQPFTGTRLPNLLGFVMKQKGWVSAYAFPFSIASDRAKEVITTKEFTTVAPHSFLERYKIDFEQVLCELLLAKRFKEALELCEAKSQSDLWQQVLSQLIDSLVKEGKLELAVDTLLTVVVTYRWSDTVCKSCTLLLSALVKQNCKALALLFCREAHFFQKEFTRDLPLDEKLMLFRWITEAGWRYLDKQGLYDALMVQNRYDEALDVAKVMKSWEKTCDNEFWEIAAGYAKKDIGRAREVGSLMYTHFPIPFRVVMKGFFQISLLWQRIAP